MTSPAPTSTQSECADVRVRASETGRVVPIRPRTGEPSARTHAISRSPHVIKTGEPSKIRNFVSQHAGEVKTSLADGFLGQDRPQNLTTVAKQVTANPVTWFRLAAYAVAFLICFAVDTDKRATVTASLLTLSLLTAWAIAALAH